MKFWRSIVGKLWATIIGLVAVVLIVLGLFLLQYIDVNFAHPNEIKKLFVYTGIIGFSLTTFFAFFLFTKITQPLRQLKKAADAITRGEFHAHVETHSSDEIGELAKAFNHMSERLQKTIEDLNHGKEHLDSVLRSMSDAVLTFDAEGKLILANPQGKKIIQEWAQFSDQDDAYGEVPEPHKALYHSVIAGAEELTSRVHAHNGVWSVVMTPLHSNNGVRGAVAVLRDITEEDRLNKLREDFVANVSHELRTPLSMLQGYSEALLDDIVSTPEERKEIARVILDESMRMGRLVADLLDLTKMQMGHFDLNCHNVDIKALAERMIRKFSNMLKEKEISVEKQFADPPMIVYGDEDRLEQILTNLLDNAIRHSPRNGRITLRGTLITAEEKRLVRIEVENEGPGIPKEDLPFIFERFYKADKARTRGASGGTGLGLSIVKSLVEAHGGSVEVESKNDLTKFSFTIPCAVD